MPQATGASATFEIKGFDIKGDVPITSAESSRLLAPFIGPGATIDTLQVRAGKSRSREGDCLVVAPFLDEGARAPCEAARQP